MAKLVGLQISLYPAEQPIYREICAFHQWSYPEERSKPYVRVQFMKAADDGFFVFPDLSKINVAGTGEDFARCFQEAARTHQFIEINCQDSYPSAKLVPN